MIKSEVFYLPKKVEYNKCINVVVYVQIIATGRLATCLVIEFLDFFELESSKAVFEVESSCVRNVYCVYYVYMMYFDCDNGG